MNYRKGSAKKNHMSPCSFWHTEQFCHIFTPVDQLLCSILHKNGPTTYNEPFTTYNIMALCVCWLIARGAVSTLYSFLKHGHDLLCMLVCLRLCVTSQLSRATLTCQSQFARLRDQSTAHIIRNTNCLSFFAVECSWQIKSSRTMATSLILSILIVAGRLDSQPFVPTWCAMLHVPQGNAADQSVIPSLFFSLSVRVS